MLCCALLGCTRHCLLDVGGVAELLQEVGSMHCSQQSCPPPVPGQEPYSGRSTPSPCSLVLPLLLHLSRLCCKGASMPVVAHGPPSVPKT